MALIKLTAIVDNISGKLNGTIFARNKGGHYMRSKSNPTNPRTAAQMAVRNAFGSIASVWRSLTEGQRNSWNEVAQDFPYQNRLGDTKILSGFSLHQKLNANLGQIDQPMISTPPQPQQVGILGVVGIDGSIEEGLTATSLIVTSPDGDSSVIVYATAPISTGIKNFSTRLRKIAVLNLQNFSSGIPLLESYEKEFGTPSVGQKVGFGFRVVQNETGQGGVIQEVGVIVEA